MSGGRVPAMKRYDEKRKHVKSYIRNKKEKEIMDFIKSKEEGDINNKSKRCKHENLISYIIDNKKIMKCLDCGFVTPVSRIIKTYEGGNNDKE